MLGFYSNNLFMDNEVVAMGRTGSHSDQAQAFYVFPRQFGISWSIQHNSDKKNLYIYFANVSFHCEIASHGFPVK